MNRQQRRAMKRQKDKRIKKDRKERVNIEKAKQISTGLSIAKWLESLSKEESELCGTLIQEYTKSHVSDFSMAFMEILENFLIDEKYQERSEIMNEFTEQLVITGKKMFKIEKMGGDYYMSLNNDKDKIINYYKERREKVSHEEAMQDVYMMFNKYSRSSLKNVIKTSIKAEANKETNKETDKENNCASKTCDFMSDGKCHNKYVTSGEKTCRNFNVDSLNTETKAKMFFEENKDKDKKELIKECAVKFDVKETTIERYYSNYRKEKHSIVNEDFEKEVQDMINRSKGEKEMSKFKVLKKVIVLDLEGECGQYHIENNKVNFNDVEYANAEDVESSFKAKEEELTNRLIALRKQKEELKQVMKEYVNEV